MAVATYSRPLRRSSSAGEATRKPKPTKVTADYVIKSLGSDMRGDVLHYAEEAREGTGLSFDESVMAGLRRWQKRWS